ncbi:MerR family transcriptional regulator [Lacrimispora celerecrescens]|uniref:DNA-binding transcriptional MerR regulator n=1 Tax=[Clostridium] celerecrescens 18A TaxID=1286362 RepID=A0A2M8Z5R4_9FIRM|nr:MerR family transcriptional regulator [Lacrimispora celerecrescens]PJJ28775.1 DNA-binding transcriptional MerR regulator [[Clostridium] celerecrescens 18A]
MLIKVVCEKCKLTKKAIEYYESKNLIHPNILENGYRDYTDADISVLKEISVLRKCGISIADIAEIRNSLNKPAALAKCKYITELRRQRLNNIQKCIDSLIADYDVNREFDYLQTHDEDLYTIKEKLVFAFPGNYGLYISMHFGRFLNGTIETEDQRKAYDAIVQYLDHVGLYLPSELSEFLEAFFTVSTKSDAVKVEEETNDRMLDMLTDTEGYLERNHEQIEQYINYKNSEEYKNSEAAKIQRFMLDFQKESGYQEVLIANMKILSPSYAEYLKKVEAANEIMLKKFPKAKDMYE